ncbi:MAG: InlB B-repeat-containing protein [Bacilli bacterium]
MSIISRGKIVRKSLILFTLIFVIAFTISGCTNVIDVTGINVDKDEVEVFVGGTIQVKGSVIPSNATSKNLEWYSNNSEIAKVNDGLIEGVSIGDTTVTVSHGDFQKIINVSVKALEYTLTFDTDGGSVFSEQKLAAGEVPTYPGAPVKANHKFLGWFEADLTTEFNFNSTLKEDTVAYAKWEINKVKVVFKLGTSTYEEVNVNYGGKVEEPTIPTKAGYSFIGWYINEELFDFNSEITSQIELTAGFEPNTDTAYTVKHYKFNIETEEFDLVETENLTGTTGETVKPVLKTYDGLMPEEEYEGVVLPDGSLVIEVRYVLWNFSLEYVLNGGNFTYESRADMVEDFLKDSGAALKRVDTLATIDGYENWSPIDYHEFFLNPTYKDKWMWIPKYLSVVGSTTNKNASRDLTQSTTVSQFTSKNSNHVYALTYEVRGFILGKKYTKNASWMSSDYSDYQLQNGFWDTFVENNEITKFENLKEEQTLITNAYKEGYNFGGWYLNSDFTGDPVTKISSNAKLYAKWVEKNPVTEIKINNTETVMEKFSTLQLLFDVLPNEAFNKTVAFSSTNDKVLKVSDTGLVTALNAGTASIVIKAVVSGITATIELTVTPQDDIVVKYSDNFTGTLFVNEETSLELSGVGELTNSSFSYVSSNPNVISVSPEGIIKGLSVGVGTIEVKLASDSSDLLTLTITVIEELSEVRIDRLIDLIQKANNPVVDTVNASLYYDDWSSFQQYYDSVYGSVNKFLFDGLNLDKTTYLINPAVQTNKTGGVKSSTEFITVHDTANLGGGLKNHGEYWRQTTHSTSIHFTVGDYGVVQSLDTKYIAHHAGDGTGTTFTWTDTGLASNDNLQPAISISTNGYFTFNGLESTVLAPVGHNDEILDDSYFSNLGPTWKIGSNGNYYLGTHWFVDSQVERGVIASKGGNNNSTGIEMCVNTDGNIYDTWQRTAKLVAQLLIEHDLDLNRVVQHNTFTGKNCPQSLIMSDYWKTFMEMVELEHIVMKDFSDAKITFTSNNPNLVSNRGLVIGWPSKATSVTYTVGVEIDGVTKSITLGSVIPGTSSWSQFDGYFSTK